MSITCLKGKVPNHARIFEKYSEGNVADVSIDHVEIQNNTGSIIAHLSFKQLAYLGS